MNANLITFPVRTTRSLEDSLLLQAQKMAQGTNTKIDITASWNDMFSSRPFDTPMFTALNNRACVLLYFSSNTLPDRNWIAQILGRSDAMKVHFFTFLQGRYPILRSNYFFPRPAASPAVMETPLNIRDGHVQEFCSAILADPVMDVIVKHQADEEQYFHSAFRAYELPRILKSELKKALAHFQPALTQNDFNDSYRLMTEVIPSSDSIILASNLAVLQRIGYAQNEYIKKEFSGDRFGSDHSDETETTTPAAESSGQAATSTTSDNKPSETGGKEPGSFNVRTFDIDLSDDQ